MTDQSDGRVAQALKTASMGAFQIRVIAICFIIAMLDGFDTQSIAFVAPTLKSTWDVAPDAFGLLFGSSLFGTMLGAIFFGVLADRMGRKAIILFCVLMFGVMSLLCATATSVNELMFYRFITGLGLGGVIPNIIALTSEYAPERVRTTAVTVMFTGFPLGAILGGMGSAQLIQMYDWHAVFVAGGILPLCILPVILLGLPESVRYLALKRKDAGKVVAIMEKIEPGFAASGFELPQLSDKPAPTHGVRDLFTHGRAVWTLLLWVVISMSLLLTYFLVNWIPATLADAGLDRHDAIMGAVTLNVGGVLGSILVSRLSDRYGPFFPLIGGYSMGIVAIGAIGFNASNIPVVMTVIFFAGFFLMGAQLALGALTARHYPTYMRSTGIGWSMGFGRTGSALGPVIGGALLAWGLDTVGLFLAATIPAFVVVIALFAMRRNVPPASENAAAE